MTRSNMEFFLKDAEHRIYRAYSANCTRVYQVQEIQGFWTATVQKGARSLCIRRGLPYRTDAMIACNEHEDSVLAERS